MKKDILITVSVIILLVVVGGAFYGGMTYAKNQKNSIRNFQQGVNNLQGLGSRQLGGVGGLIMGDIISKDNNSLTLQIPNNGGSKIIFYSNTTQISKMATGTANDFSIGTSVSVSGTTNSDGSVTAQSVQIRPAGQDRLGSQNSGQWNARLQ